MGRHFQILSIICLSPSLTGKLQPIRWTDHITWSNAYQSQSVEQWKPSKHAIHVVFQQEKLSVLFFEPLTMKKYSTTTYSNLFSSCRCCFQQRALNHTRSSCCSCQQVCWLVQITVVWTAGYIILTSRNVLFYCLSSMLVTMYLYPEYHLT